MKNLLLPSLFIAAVLLLAGCASSPQSRYYMLNPLAAQEAQQSGPVMTTVAVSIIPVEIPDYLNRPQIVTREGSNELKLAEYDRWGGGLQENIGMVLAINLAQLLGSEHVGLFPRARTAAPDYTVALRVLQLDCTPGVQVELKVQWTLLTGTEPKQALTRTKSYREKPGDKQYPSLVAAASRTLEQLSRDIAREIAAMAAARQ